MTGFIESEFFDGCGKEFLVKSTLSAIYGSCDMGFKLDDLSTISVTHAQCPNSLISRLKIPIVSNMTCRKVDAYYLIVVNDGCIDYEIDGKKIQAKPGDCVAINYGQSLKRQTGDEGMDVFVLKLKKDNFLRLMNTYMEENLPPEICFHNYLSADNPKAVFLKAAIEHTNVEMLRMNIVKHDEGDEQDYYRAMINNLESYFLRTVLLSFRKKLPLSEVLDNTNRTPLPRYLVNAIKYINSNIYDPINIKELSELLGVSQRILSHAFQTHIGIPPKQYIKSVRLDRVQNELRTLGRDAVVTDVAMRWGFNQLGTFSAEYKKRFGEKPSETVRCVRPELESRAS